MRLTEENRTTNFEFWHKLARGEEFFSLCESVVKFFSDISAISAVRYFFRFLRAFVVIFLCLSVAKY
jgi:hypothetical protein